MTEQDKFRNVEELDVGEAECACENVGTGWRGRTASLQRAFLPAEGLTLFWKSHRGIFQQPTVRIHFIVQKIHSLGLRVRME